MGVLDIFQPPFVHCLQIRQEELKTVYGKGPFKHTIKIRLYCKIGLTLSHGRSCVQNFHIIMNINAILIHLHVSVLNYIRRKCMDIL